MSENDATVRIQAILKEDAVASPEVNNGNKGYKATLWLRIPRRLKPSDAEVRFDAVGFRPGDLPDLMAQLKKDKTLDLVCELKGPQLQATSVRIDRVDYPLASPLCLLSG